MPEAVAFATKPRLGRQMLERAFTAGVPCSWVTGDSVYGADSALRRTIATSGRGYVMAVTSAQRLGLKPVVDWLEDVPARAWRRLSAGDGTSPQARRSLKGPRLYDWAFLPYRSDAAFGWQKGLLIRRKIGKPGAFTFYLTLSPETTTLPELVRIAGMRWTLEAGFEAAKGEVGLDHYEVRSWTGWHRHITLAMLAHAYLTVVRRAAEGRGQHPARDESAAVHRSQSAALGSGISFGSQRPIPTPPSAAHAGADAIRSAPNTPTGDNGAQSMKPGCRTRLR